MSRPVNAGNVRVMEPIHGTKVTIRELSAADLPRLREIAATPEIVRWWGPDADIEDMLPIEVAGEIVGGIQYDEVTDPDYRSANIDVFIDPGRHGEGIGTDAVRTLARWLIDERGHHRLTIDPAADNERAIKCYTKVGFRPVGIMRNYERAGTGEWHDGLLMDLLAEDLDRSDRGESAAQVASEDPVRLL
jgi:aminoglycoside 6'-N-acetyltransferase